MKKRITAILLSVCLAFGMGNGVAYAAAEAAEPAENARRVEGTEGDYDYRLEDDSTVEITYYAGNEAEVVVPKEIGGGIVTKIGSEAFKGCSRMKNITLPDTVNNIGMGAFESCRRLTSISLPTGVTSIASDTFHGCSALKEIQFSERLEYIGSYAFSGCSSLESFEIPTGMTRLEDGVFYECRALTEVIIPQGVNRIGQSAFSGCSSLAEIDLPDSVIYLEDYAFSDCSSLTDVKLPNAVTTLPMGVFQNCSSLTGITMADRINEIGESAFGNCISLKEMRIPSDVTEIKACTFQGCSSLKEITLSSGLSSIGENAFEYCSKLTDIIIPDRVAVIGYGAFLGCSSLKEIAIPDSVEEIEIRAFAACENLEKITVAEKNPVYDSRENCNGIIETAQNRLYIGCKATVIPKSVPVIGSYAFDRFGQSSIKIPVTITDIEEYAFSDDLRDIFYEGTKEEWKAAHVVGGDIWEVSIHYQSTGKPGNPESDYRYLIMEDGNVKINGYIGEASDITVPDTLAGRKVIGLTDCVWRGSKLTSVILPEKISNIPNFAFSKSSRLKSVTIPVSVTEIGWDAFAGCTALKDVYYGGSALEWERIWKESGNEALSKAKIHYGKKCSHSQTIVKDAARAATCTKSGLTAGSHCAACGEIIKKQEYIPAKGHSYQTIKKPATFSRDGSVVTKCRACGKEKSKVIIRYPKRVTLSKTSVSYNGTSQKPSVMVKDSKGNTVSNKNFTISYTNNKNIGTATVTITGKGNYSGTVKKTFKIVPKKGSTFTVGSYKYEITGSSTAAFAGIRSSTKTAVTVADTVKIGGKTFQVTSIKSKALYKKTKVIQVTIGTKVKTIGSQAFYGCSSLKGITVKSTVLQTVGSNALKGIRSNAAIKVPSKKLTAYKKLLNGRGQSSKVKIAK